MPRLAHLAARFLFIIALFGMPGRLSAQGLEYVRGHYTKYEYRIPMRDGVKLFTAVYVPKDASETRRYPILFDRTPYSVAPYGEDRFKPDLGPSPLFGKEGYIFAYQDVRGRWMSEGEFVNMRPQRDEKRGPKNIDESSDTFDTIDWLVKNVANHNGKVGMWGISYPGFYTSAGMIDAHPALKAASPQAPIADWFLGDDWHHNGALQLPHAFNFMAVFGRPRPQPTKKFEYKFDHGTPDGYRFFLDLGPLSRVDEVYYRGDVAFWNEVMRHGTYDAFWKERNLRPHLKAIKPAVLTVGGWFDAENLFGALETYKSVEARSPGAVNTMVVGPWVHGGWSRGNGESLGPVSFHAQTAAFYREHIELPFFEYHLKGKADPKLPEAYIFETGTNEWKRHDAWPPKDAKSRSLYLRAGGGLAFDPLDDSSASDDAQAFDEYTSDPSRPVPYLNKIDTKMAVEYMVEDQRFASWRPDVLVYRTEPLESDVTIIGPIAAELHVATSGTDSDWVVKLIDVYPDDYPDPEPNPAGVRMGGYQQLVRGDVMRGKFRNSFEDPEPFTPDRPTPVKFAIQDIAHTFRAGHRIMVQVQSSWFPLIDRNPQTFVDIYTAKPSDFQKARQRVYRGGNKASRLRVLVQP